MKRLEVFLLPLDGMLVHCRSLPRNFVRFPQQIAGTHLYTWVERDTVRVKCLAQEHNTLSPARDQTRTTQSMVVQNIFLICFDGTLQYNCIQSQTPCFHGTFNMLLFYSFTAKYAALQNQNHAYLEKNESGIHVKVCLEVENLQIFNQPQSKGRLRKIITTFFQIYTLF